MTSVEERFWAQVQKSDGCWVWSGRSFKQGYGRFRVYGTGPKRKGGGTRKDVQTHRFVWEITRGVIPDGLLVCHHCDNPPCVRPDHLFIGTSHDNVLDAYQKGRMSPPHGLGAASKGYWADVTRSARHRDSLRQAARHRVFAQ
jgi:hypothetical protein